MDTNNSILPDFRSKRLSLGLTRPELAEAAGVSPASIYRLETMGPESMRDITIARVMAALNGTIASRAAAARRTPKAPARKAPKSTRGGAPRGMGSGAADRVAALAEEIRNLSPGARAYIKELLG